MKVVEKKIASEAILDKLKTETDEQKKSDLYD